MSHGVLMECRKATSTAIKRESVGLSVMNAAQKDLEKAFADFHP
jgi:hypothetical protein